MTEARQPSDREVTVQQKFLSLVAEKLDAPVETQEYENFCQSMPSWERNLRRHHLAEELRTLAQNREAIAGHLAEAKSSAPAAGFFNVKLLNDAKKVLYFWIKDETKRTPDGKSTPITYSSFRAFAQYLGSRNIANTHERRIRELKNVGLLVKIQSTPVAMFLPRPDLVDAPEQLIG